jgi:hypothetical protein
MGPEISNNKFEIPNKLQIPISNELKYFIFNLGDWNLFEIWYLGFGASCIYFANLSLLFQLFSSDHLEYLMP